MKMAKRKELKNIMIGILSSFISRNNDVDGYWALGKICKFMTENKLFNVKVDLLKRITIPYYEEFDYRLNFYADKLVTNVEKRLLNMNNVHEAFIIIEDVNIGELIVRARVKDDLNRVFTMAHKICCYPHSPSVEEKSVRVYFKNEKDKVKKTLLINKVSDLLKKKRLPHKPISNNTIHSFEDRALEKYLAGKNFSSMSHYNQKLIVYDIGFLNHDAFRYYIFEVILLVLEEKNVFSDDAFVQELFFSDYNRDKLLKFNND